MSFHRFAAELSLITLTLWLQSAGVAALIAWVRRALQGEMHTMGAFRLAALVVRLAIAVVVLHGLEIMLWAGFYRWRFLPSWDSAVYFSASSYSTLGSEIARAIRYLDPDSCAEKSGEDTGTLLGIGISLLMALTGALTYIGLYVREL